MKRRADDNEDTVRNRLDAYHAQTSPLAGWYRERGLFSAVNGDQDIGKVGEEIAAIL